MKNKVLLSVILGVLMLILSSCGTSGKQADTESRQKEETAASSRKEEAQPAESQKTETQPEEIRPSESRTEKSEPEKSSEEPAASTADPSAPLVPFKVGIFSTDNMSAGIWEVAAKLLKRQGIGLEIVKKEPGVSLSEYLTQGEIEICLGGILGNRALNPGTGEKSDAAFSIVGFAYGYPGHMYSKKVDSLDKLPEGAEIYYPAGDVHQVLLMLQAAGFIKVKEDMPYFRMPTEEEADRLAEEYIESYEKDIKLKSYLTTAYGNTITNSLDDLDAFIMNARDVLTEKMTGNFWNVSLILEDPLADTLNMTTMIVRKEDTEDPERLDIVEKVVKAYQSDEVRDYYKKHDSNMAPAGWDIDLISQYR